MIWSRNAKRCVLKFYGMKIDFQMILILLGVVLVRYSICIAILVNVRYRYLVVSQYFDISNESMTSQTILGRYTSIEYRMKYRVSYDTILDP